MATFRVFFTDGEQFLVNAETPADARSRAQDRRRDCLITKIKLVRGNANG